MKFHIEFEVDSASDTIRADISNALKQAEKEALNVYRGPNKTISLKNLNKIIGSMRLVR
jgi:hypothetical protein